MEDFYNRIFNLEYREKCHKMCPLECTSIEYSLTTSFSDYPTAYYAEILKNETKVCDMLYNNKTEVTYDSLKKSFLMINIYFDELKYTRVSESKRVTEVNLLSSIGGTLGLFLGVSVLSFFEFIELFIDILYIFFENKIHHRKYIIEKGSTTSR